MNKVLDRPTTEALATDALPTITLHVSERQNSDVQAADVPTLGGKITHQPEHSSLLETLEAHDVAIEYQCRAGYCGSCRLRLLAGKVIYTHPPLAVLQVGEILPCCCLPAGDIELEI